MSIYFNKFYFKSIKYNIYKVLLYIISAYIIYLIHSTNFKYKWKLTFSMFFAFIYVFLSFILRKCYYMFEEKNLQTRNTLYNTNDNKDDNYRLRFAPSPTGEMHVGNLRTAIFNFIFTKQKNGRFFLRIEDTDIKRSNTIYETSIKNTLKWMNIKYEPLILRQSERFPLYMKFAMDLLAKGFLYYCNCNTLDENTKSCECEKDNFTTGLLRFKIPRNERISFIDEILGLITVNTNTIENFAILRSDGSPTYNFCVVIDDVELKITHVFRGNEHLYNTFKQILIYEALNMPMPKFGHFPMINGKDGKKLSKRSGDTSVIAYRNMGVVPEALFNFLIRLGWGHGNDEIFTMEEAIKLFDINRISPSPAMFDINKLTYLSGYYLNKNWEKYLPEIITYIELKLSRSITLHERNQLAALIPEFAKRAKLINELGDMLLFIFKEFIPKNSENLNKDLLKNIIEVLKEVDYLNWKEAHLHILFKEKFSNEMKDVCGQIRWGLVNLNFSPSIFLILEVLDKKDSLERLESFI